MVNQDTTGMNLGFAGHMGLVCERAFSVPVLTGSYYCQVCSFSSVLRSRLCILNGGEGKGLLWNICKTAHILFCVCTLFL